MKFHQIFLELGQLPMKIPMKKLTHQKKLKKNQYLMFQIYKKPKILLKRKKNAPVSLGRVSISSDYQAFGTPLT